MDLDLNKKHALITGASRGIGVAIAEKFLKEKADVTIVSRGSKQLFEVEKRLRDEFGEKRIFAEVCDCTSESSLNILKKKVTERLGCIDIVVANVGDGQSVSDPIPEGKQWKKTWDNNFETALCTARVFLPMLRETNGSLLFISSISGREAFGAPVDYSTAKTAVIAFSKNLARKLAGEVRVNTIAPGNIFFPEGSWDNKIKLDSKNVESIINAVPMKRFGTPEEIADSAVFLCSDRASFITGSLLVIDGGQTVGVF